MKVIISGGTGLIGRAVVTALKRRGDEVIVLSRNPDRARPMPQGVTLIRWDGKTAAGWAHWVNGADAMINLAGENISSGRWSAARKERIRESRLNAGQAVVEAIAQVERPPQVLIQASAVGYYGPRGDEIIIETARPGDDFLAQVVMAWEASTVPVEGMGVRRATIRTGVVLSREGGALPKMALPFRFFVGGSTGSGRQWLPWIQMADEVGAILFLLDRDDAAGPFNLTAPNPVTNADFAAVLGHVMGRPNWLPVPAIALNLLLGKMATIVLKGQRALPERLLDLGFQFRFPTLEAALAALFRP